MDALSYLARRHRDQAIVCRYLDGETLRYIGHNFRLTHERIRQILTDAGIPIRSRGYRSLNPIRSRTASPLSGAEPAGAEQAPSLGGQHREGC